MGVLVLLCVQSVVPLSAGLAADLGPSDSPLAGPGPCRVFGAVFRVFDLCFGFYNIHACVGQELLQFFLTIVSLGLTFPCMGRTQFGGCGLLICGRVRCAPCFWVGACIRCSPVQGLLFLSLPLSSDNFYSPPLSFLGVAPAGCASALLVGMMGSPSVRFIGCLPVGRLFLAPWPLGPAGWGYTPFLWAYLSTDSFFLFFFWPITYESVIIGGQALSLAGSSRHCLSLSVM